MFFHKSDAVGSFIGPQPHEDEISTQKQYSTHALHECLILGQSIQLGLDSRLNLYQSCRPGLLGCDGIPVVVEDRHKCSFEPKILAQLIKGDRKLVPSDI